MTEPTDTVPEPDVDSIRKRADVTLVRQREDWDCGIACLAMVTGRSYEQVVETFPPDSRVNNSIAQAQVEAYLTIYSDLFCRRVYSRTSLGDAATWPPEPFASLHICIVQQPSGNGHFVVMLANGTVLDPLSDEPKRLTDWAVVNCVIGLGDIPALLDALATAREERDSARADADRFMENRNEKIDWLEEHLAIARGAQYRAVDTMVQLRGELSAAQARNEQLSRIIEIHREHGHDLPALSTVETPPEKPDE